MVPRNIGRVPLTIRLLYATGAAVIVAFGCTRIVEPSLDPRAELFQPPTVYSRWWTMTESCSGLRGSLTDITWYQVPGSDAVELGGREVGGYWTPASNSIVLAGNGVLVGNFVRHEMLHALIRAPTGHKREDFLEKCGGIVSCAADCISDAGSFPTPDASVARVSSDVLDVSTSLIPSLPLQFSDDGFFTLVVTARNPKDYPIFVLLNPPGWNRIFAYTLSGPLGALGNIETSSDPEFAYFKPGESKQHYFDLKVGAAVTAPRTLAPGAYTLIASYDDNRVMRENVQIGGTLLINKSQQREGAVSSRQR